MGALILLDCKALPAILMLQDKQVHQSVCGPLGKTQMHVRVFVIQTLCQQLQEIYDSIHATDVLLCLHNVNSHTMLTQLQHSLGV